MNYFVINFAFTNFASESFNMHFINYKNTIK